MPDWSMFTAIRFSVYKKGVRLDGEEREFGIKKKGAKKGRKTKKSTPKGKKTREDQFFKYFVPSD